METVAISEMNSRIIERIASGAELWMAVPVFGNMASRVFGMSSWSSVE